MGIFRAQLTRPRDRILSQVTPNKHATRDSAVGRSDSTVLLALCLAVLYGFLLGFLVGWLI